jgi:prepilin-type N-terminal cleavage/methylation domain-containing protein
LEAGQAGFTLIEVLAALALSSLLLVSLNLAMTTATQGVEQTRQSLGSQAAISAAAHVVALDVARIARVRRAGDSGYLFEGTARQMIYPLAERQGARQGNFFLVRLSVEDEGGLSRLVRERAPFRAGETPTATPAWGAAVILLEGAFDIGLAYRAQRSGERRWNETWTGTQGMPEQVRLTLADRRTGRLRIPVLVQSLHIDAEVECAADPAACGRPEQGGATP